MSWPNKLSLGAICALGLCLGASTTVSVNMYERSLKARLSPTFTQQGPTDSELLFLGDSRVSQWQQWDQFNARYLGFPGATSFQILGSLATNSSLDYCASTVVIQLGINDIKLVGVDAGKQELVINDAVSNISKIAELIAGCSDKVIIQSIIAASTPGPVRSLFWNDAVNVSVTTINHRLLDSNLANNVVVSNVEGIFLSEPNAFYADTLHFTEAGYKKLNQSIEEFK